MTTTHRLSHQLLRGELSNLTFSRIHALRQGGSSGVHCIYRLRRLDTKELPTPSGCFDVITQTILRANTLVMSELLAALEDTSRRPLLPLTTMTTYAPIKKTIEDDEDDDDPYLCPLTRRRITLPAEDLYEDDTYLHQTYKMTTTADIVAAVESAVIEYNTRNSTLITIVDSTAIDDDDSDASVWITIPQHQTAHRGFEME